MKALSRRREVAGLVLALCAGLVLLGGCGGGAKTGAVGAGLVGPSGVRASVYAHGPAHVSAFAFDARGRLWMTASGANGHAGDGIYELARAGARPVKVAVVRGPLGLVWIGSRLYVSSLGQVTVFGGLRGSRFEQRRVVLTGPPGAGENNNLVLSPAGRLLMGVSASCDHCRPSTRWSGSIVSFTPAGTGLALVAGRIRAPYGLAYYPGTSDLFATLNQRDDLAAATPGDWLASVRPGESWGFPGCYGQSGPACAGVPKPVAVLDPHAGAGGLAFVTSGRFADSAIVAEWNLGKVMRVKLHRTATGYTGKATTFLTGIAHPLPIVAAGDDSLLVGDWQTGRIYRVTLG